MTIYKLVERTLSADGFDSEDWFETESLYATEKLAKEKLNELRLKHSTNLHTKLENDVENGFICTNDDEHRTYMYSITQLDVKER